MPRKVEDRHRRTVRQEILLSPVERRELEALSKRWGCSMGGCIQRMIQHHAVRELAR